MIKINPWGRRAIAMLLLLVSFVTVQAKTVVFTAFPNSEGTVFWDKEKYGTSDDAVTVESPEISLTTNFASESNYNASRGFVTYNGTTFTFEGKGASKITKISFYITLESSDRIETQSKEKLSFDSSNLSYNWTAPTEGVSNLSLKVVSGDDRIYITIKRIEVETGEAEPVVPDPVYYSVTAEAGEGGSVSISGSNEEGKVEQGKDVTVTFSPEEGYELTSVVVNNEDKLEDVTEQGTLTLTVNEDLNIKAVFKKKASPVYYYSVTAEDAVGGSVSISGSNEEGKVEQGKDVTVSFTPNDGYELKSVFVNDIDKTENLTNGVLTLNVTEDLKIKVVFEKKTYAVTFGDGFSVTVGEESISSGSKVEHGTEIIVSVTIPEGKTLGTLTINDSEVNPVDGKYKHTVTEECTISATFNDIPKPQTYSVSWEETDGAEVIIHIDSEGGRPCQNGENLPAGAKLAIQAEGKTGYTLKKLIVNEKVYTKDDVHNQKDNTLGIEILSLDSDLNIRTEVTKNPDFKLSWNGQDAKTYNVTVRNSEGTELQSPVTLEEGTSVFVDVVPNNGRNIKSTKPVVLMDGMSDGKILNKELILSRELVEDENAKSPFDLTITAETEAKSYGKENVSIEGTGVGIEIDGNPLTDKTVLTHGQKIKIKLSAGEGKVFESIKVNDSPIANCIGKETVEISHTVTGAIKIEAVTKDKPAETFSVTWDASEGLNVVVSSNGTALSSETLVEKGSEVVIKIESQEGYRLLSVKINDEEQEIETEGNFEKTITLSENLVIEATAEKKKFGVKIGTVENVTVKVDGQTLTEPVMKEYGEEITIDAEAADGYELVEMKVNGEVKETPLTMVITGAVEIDARATKKHYTINVTEGDHYTITVNDEELTSSSKFDHGATVKVKIIATEGYQLKNVKIGGTEQEIKDRSIFETDVTIGANIEIEVTTEPKQYKLTIGGENIKAKVNNVEFTEELNINHGEELNIVIEPSTGYKLESVVVNDEAQTLDDGKFEGTVTAKGDVKIAAVAKLKEYSIKIEGGENVAITIEDEIVTDNTKLRHGEAVELKIAAKSGYRLQSISINGQKTEAGGASEKRIQITPTADVELKIEAEEIPMKGISWSVPESVNIVVSKDGVSIANGTELAEGTKVTVKVEAKPGYELTSVKIAGTEYTPEDKSTFEKEITTGTSALLIEVTTQPKEYELTVEAENATVNVNGKTYTGALKIKHDSKQEIRITPATGYRLNAVEINDETQEIVDNDLFNKDLQVSGNISIKVETVKKEYKLSVTGAENASVTLNGAAVTEVTRLVHGETVELKIAAKSGYRLKSVEVDGKKENAEGQTEKTISLTPVKEIRVAVETEAIPTSGLTLSKPESAEVIVTKDGKEIEEGTQLAEGTKVTVTVKAKTGYELASIKIAGTEHEIVNKTLFEKEVAVGENMLIEVTTQPKEYSLTITGANFEATVNDKGYDEPIATKHDSSLKLEIKPAEGYRLISVKVNGAVQELTDGKFTGTIAVSGDLAIVVESKKKEYSLLVTGGEHTKVSVGGHELTADTKLVHGEEVEIKIEAESGYQLKALTLDGEKIEAGDVKEKTLKVTPTKDVTLAVETALIPTSGVTWTAPENVEVSVTKDGQEIPKGTEVAAGTKLTVTVKAKAGYELVKVTIGGSEYVPENKSEFVKEVTAGSNLQIDVTSQPKEYLLTINGANMKATVNGKDYSEAVKIKHDSEIKVEIKPIAEFKLKSVKVNGETTDSVISRKVAGDIVIDVETEAIPKYQISWRMTEETGATVTVKSAGNILENGSSVLKGSKLSLNIAANTGFTLESVKINTVAKELTDGKFIGEITAESNVAIEVVTKRKEYGVKVSGNDHSVMTINGKNPSEVTKAIHGEKLEIEAKAAEGYEMKSISIGEAKTRSEDGKSVKVSHTVNGEVNITIETAAIPKKGVSWNQSEGAKVKVTANGNEITSGTELTQGTEVKIEISAEKGWRLDKVVIGGNEKELQNDSLYQELIKASDVMRIEVNVKKRKYGLSIAAEHVSVTLNDESQVPSRSTTELEHGAKAEFIVKPETGYEIESFTLNGVSDSIADRTGHRHVHQVAGPVSITAKGRKLVYHKITLTATDGVDLSAICGEKELQKTDSVKHGSMVIVKAVPREGYELKEATIGRESLTIADRSKLEKELKVEAPVDVTVKAELKKYRVAIEGGEGATVKINGEEPDTTTRIVHGQMVTITVKAREGYDLTGLEVNGTVLPFEAPKEETSVMMKVDSDLKLKIGSRAKGRHAVSWNNPTGATVNVKKVTGENIANGDSIESGKELMLKISAKTGYRIGVVKIAGETFEAANDTLFEKQFKVTGRTEIEIFTSETGSYPIVWTDSDGGKIEVRLTDTGKKLESGESVKRNTKVTARIEPEKNCKIVSITVNNEVKTPTSPSETEELVLTIDRPTTISAKFERPKCLVSVVVNDTLCGSAKIEGYGNDEAVEFPAGKLITLTAKSAEGCEFVGWLRDGKSIEGGSSLSLTIDKTSRFEAMFRSKTYRQHDVKFELSHPEHGQLTILHLENQGLNLDVKHGQKFTTTRRILVKASTTAVNTVFEKWVDEEGRILSTEPTFVYATDYDGVVKAQFIRKVKMTLEHNEGGSIEIREINSEPQSRSSSMVRDDRKIEVVLRPEKGYRVKSVTVNGSELPSDQLTTETDGSVKTTLTAKEDTEIKGTFEAETDAAEGIETDERASGVPVYYDLRGVRLGTTRPTAPGIYIERRGNNSRKIKIEG